MARASVRNDLAVTASEVLTAFALAVPVGALIGYLIAENRYFADVMKPLLFFAFSIPKSIFLPMFILVIGHRLSAEGRIRRLLDALHRHHVDDRGGRVRQGRPSAGRPLLWRDAAQTSPASIVPSMLPVLLEALRISMIFNFTGVMIAEMYASRDGIGHQIANWGENFQMKQLFAGVILIAAIAIAFNELVRWVETRCSHGERDAAQACRCARRRDRGRECRHIYARPRREVPALQDISLEVKPGASSCSSARAAAARPRC
jgi:ABC-type proline/glycine betaine transport system permease subunit